MGAANGTTLCGGESEAKIRRLDRVDVSQMVTVRSKGRQYPPEGSTSSRPPARRVSDLRDSSGECLVFLECACNVPYEDALREITCEAVSKGHGEPYVRAWAEKADGMMFGQAAEWVPKHANKMPSWYSARSLGFQFQEGQDTQLRLDLLDRDKLIGSLSLPLAEQPVHSVISHELELRQGQQSSAKCTVSFQIVDADAIRHPRTIFFVRHGESAWNKAQSKLNVYELARQNDHPLSQKGCFQAQELRQRIQEASKDIDKDILSPDVVYVSPLTRALQTAILAMGPVVVNLPSPSMVLMANSREKQNLGGFDSKPTQIGGPDVIKRAVDELMELVDGEDKNRVLSTFSQLQWDTHEVQDLWWNDVQAESPEQVQARMEEFMNQLRYSPLQKIVVVGHSHFFRAIFKKYIADSFRQRDPQFAKELGTKKLSNCGVVRLTLDPNASGGAIVDSELVLGTTLISDHGALTACCTAPEPRTGRQHEVLVDPLTP